MRLRHVDCSQPGFTRRRRGRGFSYLDTAGRPLRDTEAIERVRALAIPPAWTDVWICPHPNGHLQAVGVDRAGRRQYLYHSVWRTLRDREKFDQMLAFARALPRLRTRSVRVLGMRGLAKRRVLGFAVLLLDRGLFRIGSEVYAEDNGSYGLTTLERRHVTLQPTETLVFDYVGKTGKHIVQTISDPHLFSIGRELRGIRRRRRNFLAYEDDDGLAELHAADINAFIKDETGGDFSAKDFRTWHGTVLAAASVARSVEATETAGRRRIIDDATRAVAEVLGNTPAVSRSSYIDPRVFDLYRAGEAIPRQVADAFFENDARDKCERAVLRLLA